MLRRIRASLALKLILASAIPAAVVLLLGLFALIAHTRSLQATDPALAFRQLQRGAVLGTALSLTFAAIVTALAARRFLIQPIQSLTRVMGRAELGDFLVRARVNSEDELGRLARSFNTMLARVTDLAVAEIEQRQSLAQLEREVALQGELKALNEQLEAHIGEMELLLEVTNAVAGTLDLTALLETLGRQLCARFGVSEFSVMLIDEASHQLVIEAVAGAAPASARGMRFSLGEGITGEAAARGQTLYVPDVSRDVRYLHYKGKHVGTGSFLSIPLRLKSRLLGLMNLSRARVDGFAPSEVRLAEALAAQAALAISNARLYSETLELSLTDPLTGLPNRRQLFVSLEQEHSRSVRFGDPLSVLMIDIDLFKQVNDAHGHAAGDAVLRALAMLLRRNVRKVDVVARYGGEEFVVVLPRVPHGEALEVAEKLRRAVAGSPLRASERGEAVQITISIGVATLGVDAEDVARLVEKADEALYTAKRAGRDRISGVAPHRAAG